MIGTLNSKDLHTKPKFKEYLWLTYSKALKTTSIKLKYKKDIWTYKTET